MFFNPQISLIRAKKINGKWQFRFFAKNLDSMRPKLDADGKKMLDGKGKEIQEVIPLSDLPDGDWRRYPDNTEFGLGWVPLGGYCKIGGMIDESMDESAKMARSESWALESRPVWQRMLIMAGGVIFNFIFAILLYAMILFNYGEETIPIENEYLGYNYCQTALNHGFVNGDRILSIDGDAVSEKKDVVEKLIIEGRLNVLLYRNGDTVSVLLPKDFGERMLESREKQFLQERIPFVIDSVMAGSPAAAARLQKGDSIVGMNGKHVFEYSELRAELYACRNLKTDIAFYRSGSLLTDSIWVSDAGTIGVGLPLPSTYFKTKITKYGFFASFPAGWKLGVETLASYIKQFRLVFTKAGAQSLGGFGSMGSLFPAQWDWFRFWNMTALLSVILAFMNILPIPVLDGGYLLFLLYELIARRRPSDKFMEISLRIGMLLMLALLVYANGNDLLKIFVKY
jgi:regulator of sigma E protease